MTRRLAWIAAALVLALVPARAQDASDLLVRVNRLEGQIRQLSGQIEQLEFQNRRLEEQLRKFQQDVEFRFQEQGGGTARPATGPTASATPPATAPGPRPTRPGRGDAFDPAAQPTAPGAPRPLGMPGTDAASLPPVTPRGPGPGPVQRPGGPIVEDEPAGPMDLSNMGRPGPGSVPQGLPAGALPAPGTVQGVAPPGTPAPATGMRGPVVAGGNAVATAGTGVAKDDYDLAYGLVLQKQYEQAEMAFRQFLQAYPRDRMVPNATYWLGETYFRRGRYADAVEQYLRIYKTYGSSRVAPESMLKLALSLRGMGQPEQACATLAEIGRKYPDASTDVKAGVEREQKRGSC